jgi:hypothetical protein
MATRLTAISTRPAERRQFQRRQRRRRRVPGETCPPGPEIPQQHRIGVGALHRERVDGRPIVIPAAGTGPNQPRSSRQTSGEQPVRDPYARGRGAPVEGVDGCSEE